jgi:hypothetical protein
MKAQRQPVIPEAPPERIQEAADLLEARRQGAAEPEGGWVDRVWLPSERERQACCEGLEPDGLKDPQKLRSHCRTLLHVSHLAGVDSKLVRAEIRRRRAARGEARRGSRAARAAEAARAPLAPVARLALESPPPLTAAVDPGEAGEAAAVGAPEAPGGAGETASLDARIVQLITAKRDQLRKLTVRATEIWPELEQRLRDREAAVEGVIAETGAGALVHDLRDLLDEIANLVITRKTIRRVL